MAHLPTDPSPPSERIVLGLDVGGTKLAAGVVTGEGRVLSSVTAPSEAHQGPAAMIARHIELGRQAVSDSGLGRDAIDAIGIACGGPLDSASGVIQSPPNLPGWDEIPLVRMVSDALDCETFVDNDATAGALAEWWFGAGRTRRVRHLVYLTISTGVGGGLILDGQVYRGAAGNAGELGHLTVDYRGRECGCGRRGCLEAYASGTNIAARAREALEAGDEPSSLRSITRVTARDVADAARAGDGLASAVWDETTAILGSAVANILDVFNPELVVLGGGVTRAGAILLEPVRAQGLALAMGPARRSADVVLAELGDDLGVVSAASVALDRLSDGRAGRQARRDEAAIAVDA
ncbi:MAG TPA: ROK family protein [Candidatus Limnocylindrales bacterium]|nr:ROK family protein [Candidatus Limnocylindrales bacterium]